MSARASALTALAAVLSAFTLCAASALAAGAGSANPGAPVTVEGQIRPDAVRARVQAYMRSVPAGPHDESIGRWRAPICPLVGGLSRDQAELILRRLSEVAVSVGAPLGPEKCRPNLYVLAAADPKAMLKEWSAKEADLFGDRPGARADLFIKTDRPVRVWHNASSVPEDGRVMARNDTRYNGSPMQPHANDSRIVENTGRFTSSVIVVLDPSVAKVKIGQLADYIALTSFTEVDQNADIGDTPSILQLFRDKAEAPPGLTAWDAAYLKALYDVPPNVRLQRMLIANGMEKRVVR